MSEETAETLVRSYMSTEQPVYSFGWQGGEPTLMGTDFFRFVVDRQKAHGRTGARVANGLQTNGIAISDEMAQLFHDYSFLLGVSLDGPAELHDRYRKDAAGKGTHARVLQGIKKLEAAGVDFNILVLVSAANVNHGREVYRYLVDQGFYYHQYIPCLEKAPDGAPAEFSIDGEGWGEFLTQVHDEWIKGDQRRVSIRHVDSILQLLVNGAVTSCTMGGACNAYFVVEYNGDVFPCDFYVQDDLRLGNIAADSWEALIASPARRKFAAAKARWPASCSSCSYLHLCSGDCVKHRNPVSELCSGWKRYYGHALHDLESLAASVPKQPGSTGALFDPATLDPEEKCYCGSGKKAKHCHAAPYINC